MKLEKEKLNQEVELKKLELNLQFELAKIKSQGQMQREYVPTDFETNNSKREFTLPKMNFRQFKVI